MKRKIISIGLSILFIALIATYLYTNRDIFNEIKEIKAIYIAPISALIIASLYVNGIFLKILAKPFNINLKEHFLLSIVASFFNLITPFRGGAAIRAYYMKKKHNLKYSEFISSLFGNYIIVFLVSSFSALIVFTIIYLKYQIFAPIISAIFLFIFLGTLSLITFHFSFKKENFISSKINKVLKGWKTIVKHPKLIPELTIFTVLNLVISALIIQLIFKGLSHEINFLQAYFLSIMTILSIFLNITPGSLGITESLYMISGNVLGIPPGISLIAALILRATTSIILLILGPIGNIFLLKKLK